MRWSSHRGPAEGTSNALEFGVRTVALAVLFALARVRDLTGGPDKLAKCSTFGVPLSLRSNTAQGDVYIWLSSFGAVQCTSASSLLLDVDLAYWKENHKQEFYRGLNLIITRISESQKGRDNENNMIK